MYSNIIGWNKRNKLQKTGMGGESAPVAPLVYTLVLLVSMINDLPNR